MKGELMFRSILNFETNFLEQVAGEHVNNTSSFVHINQLPFLYGWIMLKSANYRASQLVAFIWFWNALSLLAPSSGLMDCHGVFEKPSYTP